MYDIYFEIGRNSKTVSNVNHYPTAINVKTVIFSFNYNADLKIKD